MRGNNVLGIIFSNTHDEMLRELTDVRTMGSVPYGGRYRLIDFQISNLVNSGVNKIGVIAKSNYQSLLDHVGSGKSWDLSRKRGGLSILPPFSTGTGIYHGKVEALLGNLSFLRGSQEDYVVLTDCDIVCNIDVSALVKAHIEKKADITIAYKAGGAPKHTAEKLVLDVNKSRRVTGTIPADMADEKSAWGMNMYVMGRQFLIDSLKRCFNEGKVDFRRDLIMKSIDQGKVYGYKFDGYTGVINSVGQYFEANMDLLKSKVRTDLFNPDRPIFTKVRDEQPAKYGLGSQVVNSFVADGCIIDGEVTNCVLFRGAKVKKGAVLKNCIIMQDCVIGEDCELVNVIIDKNAVLNDGRKLVGFESYPVYVNKGSVV
ncbi:MAG: glucose-1-phosphate adenylyltransferase subunit GlgD [Clostridia bacterium]|nr:glucose-1-phosphate adenylyltransferase subunit GlgD [Clostridia bacterium]